jgi:hypothetical protein
LILNLVLRVSAGYVITPAKVLAINEFVSGSNGNNPITPNVIPDWKDNTAFGTKLRLRPGMYSLKVGKLLLLTSTLVLIIHNGLRMIFDIICETAPLTNGLVIPELEYE